MVEHGCPVVARIPGDLCRRVDLDGHHLRDAAALEDDDEGADAAALPAALFAALDVGDDEGVADVCPGDDVGGGDRESGAPSQRCFTAPYTVDYSPTMRLDMIMEAQFDKQCVLPNVGGDALELEGLEACPAEEGGVSRCELAEVLRQLLVAVATGGGASLGYLSSSVLADGLV